MVMVRGFIFRMIFGWRNYCNRKIPQELSSRLTDTIKANYFIFFRSIISLETIKNGILVN